jgi:hypothetical protein
MYLVWSRFEKNEVIVKGFTTIVLLLSPVTILIVPIYLFFNPLFYSHLYIISRVPWNEKRAELLSSSQITHFLFLNTTGNCSRNKTIHSRVSVVRLHTAYVIGFITAVFLPLFGPMILSVSLECSIIARVIQAPYEHLHFVTKCVLMHQLSVHRPLRVTWMPDIRQLVWSVLYFVGRASRYKLLLITNLTHFFMYLFISCLYMFRA